jgi:hypothetical protein
MQQQKQQQEYFHQNLTFQRKMQKESRLRMAKKTLVKNAPPSDNCKGQFLKLQYLVVKQ